MEPWDLNDGGRSFEHNQLIRSSHRRYNAEHALMRAMAALDYSDTQENRERLDAAAERLNQANAEEAAHDPTHRKRVLPPSGLGDQKYRGREIGQIRRASVAVYQLYNTNPPRGLSLFDMVYSSPYFDEIKIKQQTIV